MNTARPLDESPTRCYALQCFAHGTCVLYVDHYGNAITNLPGVDTGRVRVGGIRVPVVPTYGAAEPGSVVALTGSTGRIEVAVRDGDATRTLGLTPGTPVYWEPA